MKKVFLGGTCNGSKWRDKLIPLLKIDYFNPVVDDWNDECRIEEIKQRAKCDFCLYVITPKMVGVYSVAEVVQDSALKPSNTVLCVLKEDDRSMFHIDTLLSLNSVVDIVKANGAIVIGDIDSGRSSDEDIVAIAEYLNKSMVEIPYNENMIECLIERDGPTLMRIGTMTYCFDRNDLGGYVCEVLSHAHRKHLVNLDSFRTYQEDKAPKKEFTDEEYSFLCEWKTLSADNFVAYIHGHSILFDNSSAKIRKIAISKWVLLLPGMTCSIKAVEPVCVEKDDCEKTDIDFQKQWETLNGKSFKNFVEANKRIFVDMSGLQLKKAIDKWQKIITNKTGELWPLGDK